MQTVKFGFGQSVPRKEDDPLLRGFGRYGVQQISSKIEKIDEFYGHKTTLFGFAAQFHRADLIGDNAVTSARSTTIRTEDAVVRHSFETKRAAHFFAGRAGRGASKMDLPVLARFHHAEQMRGYFTPAKPAAGLSHWSLRAEHYPNSCRTHVAWNFRHPM